MTEVSNIVSEEISVVYEDHMGSDLTVVNAARQSFAKQKKVFSENDIGLINFLATGMRTDEWGSFLDEIIAIDDKVVLKKKLLEYKNKAQHWAPFGHPHVQLRLRLPIFLARQYVKHQVGGVWSEESRRYIDDDPTFYFEPINHYRPTENIKQGSGNSITGASAEMTNDIFIGATNASLSAYKELLLTGVAPEEAREILTLNTMTGVTWTGSLLFWARVCNQRLDPHAQKAATSIAKQINNILEELFPVSWAALVQVNQ